LYQGTQDIEGIKKNKTPKQDRSDKNKAIITLWALDTLSLITLGCVMLNALFFQTYQNNNQIKNFGEAQQNCEKLKFDKSKWTTKTLSEGSTSL